MYRLLLLLAILMAANLFGCRAAGPHPAHSSLATLTDSPQLVPVDLLQEVAPSDSLQAVAPWLAQPPKGSTKREVRKWNASRRKALENSTRSVPEKVKIKNTGNTTEKVRSNYTLKQREKLNQYDRSKQKLRADNRNQTQKDADLSQRSSVRSGFRIPAGFWIVLALVLVAWLVLKRAFSSYS